MLGRLFLLFTLVPAAELWLLISIGSVIGAPWTLALVLASGALGAWLAKREGLKVLRGWQGAVAHGEMPEEGVTASLLVLVGGVLLVTPGVLTDLVGLSLLIPATRQRVARWITGQLQHRLTAYTTEGVLGGVPPTVFDRSRPKLSETLDVEARETVPADR